MEEEEEKNEKISVWEGSTGCKQSRTVCRVRNKKIWGFEEAVGDRLVRHRGRGSILKGLEYR